MMIPNNMCDDITELENQGFYEKQLSRRDFNLLAGGAAISLAFAGCVPGEAAEGITESDVMVDTPDGTADAYFAHPATGAHAAVLIWPDIVGLRPAFKMMAKRLAGDGYAALVVNPYYRQVKGPLVEVGQTFRDPGVREKGTTGYCMGGPMTMITAATVPDRIGAGASFHGGGLATDKPNSPHLLIPTMTADYLIAIAANDDARDPENKAHNMAGARPIAPFMTREPRIKLGHECWPCSRRLWHK